MTILETPSATLGDKNNKQVCPLRQARRLELGDVNLVVTASAARESRPDVVFKLALLRLRRLETGEQKEGAVPENILPPKLAVL